MLYEAARVTLQRSAKWSWLKRRALSPTFRAGELVFFIPWRVVELGAAHLGSVRIPFTLRTVVSKPVLKWMAKSARKRAPSTAVNRTVPLRSPNFELRPGGGHPADDAVLRHAAL